MLNNFDMFTRGDRKPVVLISDAVVVAANAAARALWSDAVIGRPVGALCAKDPDTFADYVTLCSFSDTPLPGVLTHIDETGQRHRWRCDGHAAGHHGHYAPGVVLLRMQDGPEAKLRFRALNESLRQREHLSRRSAEIENKLEETAARSQRIFENAAVGMGLIGIDGTWQAVNERTCQILGRTCGDLVGSSVEASTHPDDRTADLEFVVELLGGSRDAYTLEKRFLRPGGEPVWVNLSVSLQRDQASRPLHFIAVIQDIDDRKNAEQSRDLLIGELNHRVKNTLAIVNGIAQQMAATQSDPRKFAAEFADRLQCLSRAHDALTQSEWAPLRIDALVALAVLQPFHAYRDRIDFSGPAPLLTPQECIMIAILLHELTTNAIKYGSLSVEQGCVSIDSTLQASEGVRYLRLDWTEQGGPLVAAPTSSGFGSFMLGRGITIGLSGVSRMWYRPDGLRVEIMLPLSSKQD